MASPPYKVLVYRDPSGGEPFTDWLHSLRDARTRRRILQRLFRLEHGNFGDCQPVGGGVRELRFFIGPGYRVYFGQDQGVIIVLLCGGDKSSQRRDIQQAKAYWKEYQTHA